MNVHPCRCECCQRWRKQYDDLRRQSEQDMQQVQKGHGVMFCSNGHPIVFSPPIKGYPVCLGARCLDCDEWVRTPASLEAEIGRLRRELKAALALASNRARKGGAGS